MKSKDSKSCLGEKEAEKPSVKGVPRRVKRRDVEPFEALRNLVTLHAAINLLRPLEDDTSYLLFHHMPACICVPHRVGYTSYRNEESRVKFLFF